MPDEGRPWLRAHSIITSHRYPWIKSWSGSLLQKSLRHPKLSCLIPWLRTLSSSWSRNSKLWRVPEDRLWTAKRMESSSKTNILSQTRKKSKNRRTFNTPTRSMMTTHSPETPRKALAPWRKRPKSIKSESHRSRSQRDQISITRLQLKTTPSTWKIRSSKIAELWSKWRKMRTRCTPWGIWSVLQGRLRGARVTTSSSKTQASLLPKGTTGAAT